MKSKKQKKVHFWTRWFFWRGRHKVHRQTKDRLFRFLFEKDREALLQLYNALNGTDYKDASKLQVVTIESAVYIVMKNDLAFVITGTLNLYEHQSTYNPNMPVRFLIYLAEECQLIVEQDVADALNSGKLAAAGLDVVYTEPIRPDNPLLTAKNCIITPHISWAPKESRQRIMDVTAENIRAFLAGTPQNVVNR